MFALVDCNTFYASCEQIYDPSLAGKPVVVLSNNDGCIISRNAEAKALDIPGMQPYYQVRSLLEKHRVKIFSSNYELYGDISARVMQLLEPFATELEVYSIDEAFLRVQTSDLHAHGKAIKDTLWRSARMPACVGLAPTKTLAKLANRAAKKIKKLDGVCVLDTPDKWRWLMARLSPVEVWGIGGRLTEQLAKLGITTILQLVDADPKWLRRRFNVELERTLRELNGEPCLDLELEREPRKDIICTRSFSRQVTELHELEQAVSAYAARACEKLRAQDGVAKQLWVFVERKDVSGDFVRRQNWIELPHFTDDTRMVAHYATLAMQQVFQRGLRYRKAGMGLVDVHTRKFEQRDLFSATQSEQSQRLMQMLDRVNHRYGKHTLTLANAGIQPQWAMKRDFLSPRYTTRWDDLPVIAC
ncbi:MAG TPA: Y-family DNA polymerase [Candidatus Acidoferrum sp.]|nr:Y-family DNA polymerase [Candidatus Acidoferrum sp.]